MKQLVKHESVKEIICLLVGLNGTQQAVATNALRSVFPSPKIQAIDTLEKVRDCENAGAREILVLAGATESDLNSAVETMDASGLRRWAIVTLGTTATLEGIETVAPEEWNEALLARVFRLALGQHQLMRENRKLGGDMRTIAHRIVHDLRSPLGGVFSGGDALQEALAEHDSNSAALAKPLFQSAEDLKKLVNYLSAVTNASSNPVLKEPVSMQEVVWMVLQRADRHRFKKGSVTIQPAPWPEVEGVFTWLETIWWELINAVEPGKDSNPVELGWSDESKAWRFRVRNAGTQLPPAKLEALFQPFHLLHQARSKPHLGLSVAQRLVELQGGTCGYIPDSNAGTCLYFTLPHSAPEPIVAIQPESKFA